jgi:short-subunit dehydrogenase involved in D-alanine esterification of teichoic acids
VIIDHVNLKTFLTIKTLSQKEVKWWEKLLDLDFLIEYRSEKLNSVDVSSRRVDYIESIQIVAAQCIVNEISTLSKTFEKSALIETLIDEFAECNIIVVCDWMLNLLNESSELSSNAESMQFVSKKNAARLLDDVFNIFALNYVEAITRNQKISEFAE